MDLNGIWYAAEKFWSYDSHIHFISSDQYLRERTQFRRFNHKNVTLAYIRTFTDRLLSQLL